MSTGFLYVEETEMIVEVNNMERLFFGSIRYRFPPASMCLD